MSIEVIEELLGKSGLQDAFAESHNGTHTPTDINNSTTTDYIFFRDLQLIESYVLESSLYYSNHAAVVAFFHLPR